MQCYIEVRARKYGGWIVGVRYGAPQDPGVYNWQHRASTLPELRKVLNVAAARRRYVDGQRYGLVKRNGKTVH